MKFIPHIFNFFIVGVICVILNFLMQNHSILDDGVFYKDAFDTISYRSMVGGYHMFQLMLGASEYLTFGIFYFFSQIGEYENFIFISNLFLSVLIYLVYKKYNRTLLQFILTVPLNFYFLILCFAAQRLKFGVIFLLLSVLASNKVAKYVFGLASFFSHFQMSIIFLTERVGVSLKSITVKKLLGLGFVALVFAGIMLTNPGVGAKVSSYSGASSVLSLIPFLACFFIAAHFSDYDNGVIAQFLAYFFFILLVGESRINIFAFFSMWNLIFFQKEKPVLISYAISAYLAIKGVVYILDIYHGQSGFIAP